MNIVALLDSQGTACSETALFGDEDTPAARRLIEAAVVPWKPDAPIPGTWTDCSDNEYLQAMITTDPKGLTPCTGNANRN